MTHRIAVGATLGIMLLAGSLLAADALKSGPQVGQGCVPFNPENITGPFAGSKQCLVWANGPSPVAVIFAREISKPVTSLVKKIDAATAKHDDVKMASFAVFLSDEEGLDKKLKEFADKEKIKKTALTIDSPAGPSGYKIAKDADVTVLLYVKKNVKVNYAFKKGELKDKDINKIVADLSKILPDKSEKGG